MNQHLQSILITIQEDKNLSEEEKNAIIKSLKSADKDFEITNFKLDRTEKVKRTTAILLEETIEELEQKRKAVEAQNKELEIETALERVRTVAMSMMKPDDLLGISKIQFNELKQLGFTELRNALIGIFNDGQAYFTDYDYSDFSGGSIAKIPYHKNKVVDNAIKRMKSSNDAFTEFIVEGEELEEWKAFRKANGEYDDTRITHAERLYYYFYSIESGNIGISNFEKINEAQLNILKRFRNVFDLAYKRYVDISKAEAQAREAQIEVAVERVRAQSMAMHQTNDLDKVNQEVYNQLQWLKIDGLSGVSIYFIDKEGEVTVWDLSSPGNIGDPNSYTFKFSSKKYPVLGELWQHYKNSQDYFTLDYPLEKLKAAIPEFREIDNVMANAIEEAISNGSLTHQWNAFGSIAGGLLGIDLMNPPSEDTKIIVQKMAGAFNLAYKRFLDLQKAEAQARESQIQLALERVRARTMAMYKSDELADLSFELVKQVQALGVASWFCAFNIYTEDEKGSLEWGSNAEGIYPMYRTPRENIFLRYYEAGQKGETFLINEIGENDCPAHYEYLCSLPGVGDQLLKMRDAGISFPTSQIDHVAFFKYGYIIFITYVQVPESHDIFKRFAKVFEQTYTRFLDLQKAEAQAREAEIELALERVRARTMAMQQSDELADTSWVLFKQIKDLGFETWSCGFCTWQKDDQVEVWMGADSGGLLPAMIIPYKKEPTHKNIFEASLTGEKAHDKIWEGQALQEHYDFLKTIPSVKDAINILEQSGLSLPERQCYYVGFFEQGYLLLITKETNDELKDLSKRFAKVFEQTYTRFLDLQKAEAQSRESQIEASLERVRSKAMSMQKSEDLAAAITIVFEELGKLDLGMLRCGIGVLNKEKRSADVYTTTIADNNTVVQVAGDESMDIHPLLSGAFDAWLTHEDHSYTLKGVDLNNYYKAVARENLKLPDSQSLVKAEEMTQYYYNAVWSSGGLFAFRESPFPEEAKTILRRFADVFTLTYTRFSDLKQVEAQAKEARIEVSLERVRSRTLAMQRSDELAETAAVLFQQLIQLGIEPNRLYISIVKNDKADTEFWITDEDGSKVSTAFSTNLNDNPTFAKMYTGWKQGLKSLVIDMQGEELEIYFRHLSSIGVPFKTGLGQKRRVQDIAYFSKGFIGIASPDEQPAETLQLLERFAAVFNLTFTRFSDLKVAEAHAIQAEEDLIKLQTEKKRAEDALTELRSTQTQLIQSEKMASLGELTAGIAHEIQNPLNFVNNFSEVSKELIEEMVEEVNKGNTEEVKAIAHDLVQNLEKINHHGKRADAIVKGMLQHSRTSSSAKEPTDINKLADEYLRLAYHGLRAKDKSFNATLKTAYDETIGNINIIPQDIGRVILNLITNAFYAVGEKKKEGSQVYEPIVSLTTKRSLSFVTDPDDFGGEGRGEVSISVKDNGNGIPASIKDKIFQPFFTTKPTGQGTGLGLSLAYDIVKAHGGELKVQSEESGGSCFTILLPKL